MNHRIADQEKTWEILSDIFKEQNSKGRRGYIFAQGHAVCW